MNLKFNSLCSLIKNVKISTKNDIKRLEYVVPSIINAINEHPAHTSTLIYYLAKTTSQLRLNSGCQTCNGLCKNTYQPIASHIYNILDNLSPKALAKILKVYSNCIYEDKLIDQIKLRLCYFMLSCMSFPKNYFNIFNEWTRKYKLSSEDYLISLNSSFDHSKFFLPLVTHDVADLTQSLSQELHKGHFSGTFTPFILDISADYLSMLFKTKLSEKDIHSVTRIFYFYNECSYFNDNVKALWLICMDRFIIKMNIFDICTMLHSFHNDLNKYKNPLSKILSRIDSLLSGPVNDTKSFGMVLNGLFKCNVTDSYIAQIVYDKSKSLFTSKSNPIELMQLIKGLKHFDVHLNDLVSLLHSLPFDETTFDLHDFTIIFGWFEFHRLDNACIINIINKIDLSKYKFDNLFLLSLEINKSQHWNDSIAKRLSDALKDVYNKSEANLSKLVRLYTLFTKYNEWIEKEILSFIESGDLIECFKVPLIQNSLFKEALTRRCASMSTSNILDSLLSISEIYNFSILPLEVLVKGSTLHHLSMLLSCDLEGVLPLVDINNIIKNTHKEISGRCIYKCIMSGIRGNDASVLIDLFINNKFNEFKELMMLSIIAGLPNINKEDSFKISYYVISFLRSELMARNIPEVLMVINKLIPVSFKHSYNISNDLFSIGLPLVHSLDISSDCLHLFISYAVKMDKYRIDNIISIMCRIITHCRMLRPSVLANLGLVGMQFWGTALRLRWLRLVLRHTDTTQDFYTSLQLRLFVNTSDYTLQELHLMLEILKKHEILTICPNDESIISEIRELSCIIEYSKQYNIIYL